MLSTPKLNRANLAMMAVIIGAAAATAVPLYVQIATPTPDYRYHSNAAKAYLNDPGGFVPYATKTPLRKPLIRWPHFLYPLTVVTLLRPGWSWLTPGLAQGIILMVCVFVLLWMMTRRLRRAAPRGSPPWVNALWASSGLFVGAISVFTLRPPGPTKRNRFLGHYFGYMIGNVYHNPTIIALKPLALGLMGYAGQSLRKGVVGGPSLRLLWSALLTLAAVLTKPSHIIVLLPALGLLVAYRWLIKRKPIDWQLVGGILLGSVPLLLWQYLAMFNKVKADKKRTRILFRPLAWQRLYQPKGASDWLLLVKYLGSLAFPAVVVALHWPQAIADIDLVLSWLCFFFGSVCAYLLVESGKRMSHGNFTWSGVITIFLLMHQSNEFLRRQTYVEDGKIQLRACICLFVYAMHLACGFLWLTANCLAENRFVY